MTTLAGLVELHDNLNTVIGKNDVEHYLAHINYDSNYVALDARKVASSIVRETFENQPETYYRVELVLAPLATEIAQLRKKLASA